MSKLPLVLSLVLCSIVFAQSFKVSSIFSRSSDARKHNVSSSNSSDYSSVGEDSLVEHVDCSDFNSTWAERALKWVFKSVSNRDHIPNVRFFASSRVQPGRVELFLGEAFRLEPADLKIERETVVIVHGFKSSGFKSWVIQMEQAFLLWGDVNVIVIDWSGGSKSYNYYTAAVNTKVVGNQIARFLQHVVNATMAENPSRKPNWGKLYLVGHSLGSHISGVAARDLKEMKIDWQASRITGLDPALLCFRTVNPDFRLDSTDADFVDIIHSSANAKKIVGFGNFDPIGHVDFYPNGGKVQPGCLSKKKKSIWNYLKVPMNAIKNGRCSHQRAYHYFTESLVGAASKNCTFWARPWDMRNDENATHISSEPCTEGTCTEMGINADRHPQRGTFYVSTANSAPFCIPQ